MREHARPGPDSNQEDTKAVHDDAARGVAGSGGRLPYFDRIQRAFGRHDISGIQAHTGGAAADGAQAIGAAAYATGDHVAFASAPDLHTVAHEVAHVIQQRGGVHLAEGVGAEGDAYERHADEVADAVVAGRSAESLLDRYAGSGGSTKAVQRKLGNGLAQGTPVVKHTEFGDEDHYVVVKQNGRMYQIHDTNLPEGKDTDPSLARVSPHDEDWGTRARRAQSRREWEQSKLALGTNYVSEDYKRINSLLGALEKLGKKPEDILSPTLDLTACPRFLETYHEVGIARRCLNDSEDARATWDMGHALSTLKMFRQMHSVWNKFEKKPTPANVVCRGDTAAIYKSFTFLDPTSRADGPHALDETIQWPGVMSTTVGHPKQCNISADRKVIWQIAVPADHNGRKLGDNASENEATFPLGTVVHVTRILVRKNDKKQAEDEFGDSAEVIVYAEIQSVAPAVEEDEEIEQDDAEKDEPNTNGPPPPPSGKGPPPPPSGNAPAPSTASGKQLSPQDRTQIEILKIGLRQATTSNDTDAIADFEQKIAAIEGPQLTAQERTQLEILRIGLAAAQKTQDADAIADLEQKIAAIEGGRPARKPIKPPSDDRPPVLSVGDTHTGVEDGQRYFVECIIPGGAHGAWKIVREADGACFLWKPAGAASTNDKGASAELMADAEVGGTGLANFIVGGYLVPRADRLSIADHLGTRQPFINVKKEKETFTPATLNGKRAAQLVAHMIADWIISNHDNNDTQFLYDVEDNLIGIDKGQAYKFFKEGGLESTEVTKAKTELAETPDNEAHEEKRAKIASHIEPDHLVPGYKPSSNFKVPSPGTFVDAAMQLDKLPFSWEEESVQIAIKNAEALTVEDVERFLAPYAHRVFDGREAEFYQAVVARAHRIQQDLAAIFGERYAQLEGEPTHREYKPITEPKPYTAAEVAELGKDKSGAKHQRIALNEGGQQGIQTLLADFDKFDHRGAKHHDGTLKQHSIYVANAVDYMFDAAEHPESFKGRQDGDTAAMYGDYMANIPVEMRPLLVLTGFLHDAGKAGEKDLEEDDFRVGGKPQHPREGFEMMLPSDKRGDVDDVKHANGKRTDFDYHLRDDHDHCASHGTFEFGQFFDTIKLDPKQRAVVQICTAMHYEFGSVLKPLGEAPEPKQLEAVFKKFLAKLEGITQRTEYGEVDELLVNLVIAIGAADVLGAKQVIVAAEQQTLYPFPAEESKRKSGSDSFSEYGFKDKGRLIRLALLHYFRHGKIQTFEHMKAQADVTPSNAPETPPPPGTAAPSKDERENRDDADFADRMQNGPIVAFELARYIRDSSVLTRIVDGIGPGRIRNTGTVTVGTIVEAALAENVDLARIILAAKQNTPWWRDLCRTAREHGTRAVAWELTGPMARMNDGSLTVHARSEVIDAYLADLPESRTYLSVVEGEALARAWHVRAHVFNQLSEPTNGSNLYIDPQSSKRYRAGAKTKGDGNCLIHGFSLLKKQGNASTSVVREARKAIADGVDREALRVQVTDLVRSVAQDEPQQGIGNATYRLLQTDPSVAQARKHHHDEKAKKSKEQPSESPSKLAPFLAPSTEPIARVPTPGNISFNVIYGEGESETTGILLFVNNNHYIVLEEVEEAEEEDMPALDEPRSEHRDDVKPPAPSLSLAQFQRQREREALLRQIGHYPTMRVDEELVDAVLDAVPEPSRQFKKYQELISE